MVKLPQSALEEVNARGRKTSVLLEVARHSNLLLRVFHRAKRVVLLHKLLRKINQRKLRSQVA